MFLSTDMTIHSHDHDTEHEMDVQWVGKKEMLADGFANTLPGPALSEMRDKLYLRKS